MKLRVRFFSLYSDVAGDSVDVELEDGARVKDLVRVITSLYPRLKELFADIKPIVLVNGVARNSEYKLSEGDEIAFIPPASGG